MKLHKQKKSLKNYIYFFEQHIFIKKMLQKLEAQNIQNIIKKY